MDAIILLNNRKLNKYAPKGFSAFGACFIKLRLFILAGRKPRFLFKDLPEIACIGKACHFSDFFNGEILF